MSPTFICPRHRYPGAAAAPATPRRDAALGAEAVKNLSLRPQLRPNLPKNLSLALGALRS